MSNSDHQMDRDDYHCELENEIVRLKLELAEALTANAHIVKESDDYKREARSAQKKLSKMKDEYKRCLLVIKKMDREHTQLKERYDGLLVRNETSDGSILSADRAAGESSISEIAKKRQQQYQQQEKQHYLKPENKKIETRSVSNRAGNIDRRFSLGGSVESVSETSAGNTGSPSTTTGKSAVKSFRMSRRKSLGSVSRRNSLGSVSSMESIPENMCEDALLLNKVPANSAAELNRSSDYHRSEGGEKIARRDSSSSLRSNGGLSSESTHRSMSNLSTLAPDGECVAVLSASRLTNTKRFNRISTSAQIHSTTDRNSSNKMRGATSMPQLSPPSPHAQRAMTCALFSGAPDGLLDNPEWMERMRKIASERIAGGKNEEWVQHQHQQHSPIQQQNEPNPFLQMLHQSQPTVPSRSTSGNSSSSRRASIW